MPFNDNKFLLMQCLPEQTGASTFVAHPPASQIAVNERNPKSAISNAKTNSQRGKAFREIKTKPLEAAKTATESVKVAEKKAAHEVVFVLGGPGAGKGTQCSKIAEEFKFVHLSAGDLLRAERAKAESKHADLINSYIKEGKIVPVEITVQLILAAMDKTPGKKFLIDGFPRNEDNKTGWYKEAGDRALVKFVLFYDCPLEDLKVRLLKRGETSGRADDNMESIIKRFETFNAESMPVVEWYRAQGLLKQISSVRGIEEVWADTKSVIAESETSSVN